MNDINLLKKWGWISKGEFLWWNFDLPKEERRFISSIDEFMEPFEEIVKVNDHRFMVTTTDYIPITTLPIKVKGETIHFMVTARPFSNVERNYNHWSEKAPPYDAEESSLLVQELKESVFDKSIEKRILGHFFPHVRGIVRNVNDDSIFYYPIGYKAELAIMDYFKQNNINTIGIMYQWYGYHNAQEAIWNAIDYCKEEGLTFVSVSRRGKNKLRRPEKIHNSFSYVDPEKILTADGSKYTFYPLYVEGYEKSIPYFICNNAYGEKGLFNLGVYEGQNFHPISDENLLKKAATKLTKAFGAEVKSVYFEKIKGNLKFSKFYSPD